MPRFWTPNSCRTTYGTVLPWSVVVVAISESAGGLVRVVGLEAARARVLVDVADRRRRVALRVARRPEADRHHRRRGAAVGRRVLGVADPRLDLRPLKIGPPIGWLLIVIRARAPSAKRAVTTFLPDREARDQPLRAAVLALREARADVAPADGHRSRRGRDAHERVAARDQVGAVGQHLDARRGVRGRGREQQARDGHREHLRELPPAGHRSSSDPNRLSRQSTRCTAFQQVSEPPNRRPISCKFHEVGEDAMVTLAERLRAREGELAEEIAGRYRTEIVDYAASDPDFVETDVLQVTRRRRRAASSRTSPRTRPRPRPSSSRSSGSCSRGGRTRAWRCRRSSTRSRLFGEHVFAALAACASPDRPEELQAAIRGGTVIMRFANEVIRGVTQTYLDELEDVRGDREIVSRSLLDAVLAGRAASASSVRDARILGIDLLPQNVVIVARAPVGDDRDPSAETQRPRTLRKAAMILRAQRAVAPGGRPGAGRGARGRGGVPVPRAHGGRRRARDAGRARGGAAAGRAGDVRRRRHLAPQADGGPGRLLGGARGRRARHPHRRARPRRRLRRRAGRPAAARQRERGPA